MTYYKAVDKTTGKLLSYLFWTLKSEARSYDIPDYTVEYKVGEFVKGNIGKLFVYQDLTDGEIDCMLNDNDIDLYECEVTNPSYPDKNVFASPQYIKRFWDNPRQFWRDWIERNINCDSYYDHAVNNSEQIIWADSVKLTKKVEVSYDRVSNY